MISKATVVDSEELTLLCKKSKAYWGYSTEQLNLWEEELTISKKYILENQVFKFIENKTIIGFYTLIATNKKTIQIEHLFVHPHYLGQGIGTQLMHHVIENCKTSTSHYIRVEADPNAELFYTKMGFKTIDLKPSSIKNRFLSIMELTLIS